jgi:transcriptional regulator GlxA family with amidase domain
MLIGYLFWRAARYNKVLLEKNSRLVAEIEQREQEEQQAIEQLKAEPEERLTTEQQLFRRICDLMAEQKPYTDETMNRETLAQMLATNAKYVEQAIRDCSHGETVNDFITRHRLEHVARLLKTTDDSVAIIGEMAGIPSRSTLARLFRNAYGMTCTEYRQVTNAKKSENS